MYNKVGKILLPLVTLLITLQSAAAPMHLITSNDGRFEVKIENMPEFKTGTFTQLKFSIRCVQQDTCPIDSVIVSAAMPHHGHGMKYYPEVIDDGAGRFTANGIKLHMAGYWEFYIDIGYQHVFERAQFTIQL